MSGPSRLLDDLCAINVGFEFECPDNDICTRKLELVVEHNLDLGMITNDSECK